MKKIEELKLKIAGRKFLKSMEIAAKVHARFKKKFLLLWENKA